MAADISTLQLFPKVIGNQSTFKELAYTGRFMKSDEALHIGFVSRILDDKQKLDATCLETARVIAAKSPVGIYTIKQTLIKAELKSYLEGLDDIATTNGVMLQTKDLVNAVSAFMAKQKPTFPKL
jgi:enoyl-CoA hydratase/carnithine racemase